MSIKSRLLLALLLLTTTLFTQAQTYNYTPLQITPAWNQSRGFRAQNYPDVINPDSILVKTDLRWVGRYPFSNIVVKNQSYSNPDWLSSLSYSKLTGTPTYFPTDINNVLGLSGTLSGFQTLIDGKISVGSNIPYSTITGAPNFSNVAFSGSYSDLIGLPTLFSGSFTDLTNRPSSYPSTIAQIPNLQSQLDGKQPIGNYLTRTTADAFYKPANYSPTFSEILGGLGYTPYNGLTNPNGYITASQIPAAPVTRVNGKQGDVTVTATDVGLGNVSNTSDANKPISTATQAALNTKLTATNIPFTKVRYYSVTSDANGVWSVNLGTEFTGITDVQVQGVSVGNTVGGIRQVSLNAWTSTSTTLSGLTFGSNTIATVLISAVQSLAIIPNTGVRVVVYGN